MEPALPPIPTPAAHGWRRIRQQFLPGIVFLGGLSAAAVVWNQSVTPSALVGEAEIVRADVRTVQPGTLVGVTARLFQRVRAGDTLAQIVVTDPQVLEASLAVIRAEIEVMRQTTELRTLLDYERLMLDLMSERVKLTALKAQLRQAESNFTRVKTLHAGKLVTDENFEEVQNTRDALQAQITAQTELVTRIEPEYQRFTANDPGHTRPTPAQTLRASLKLQDEKLRLVEAQLKPVTLVAPIDGIVTLVLRKPGEVVATGEPIFQVTAAAAENIVGYVRQQAGTAPLPGTIVEVRTRSRPRRTGTTTITQVGSQFEPISPTLLAALQLPVTSVPTELGRRVHVTVPTGLTLLPGEHVDLVLKD